MDRLSIKNPPAIFRYKFEKVVEPGNCAWLYRQHLGAHVGNRKFI